MLQTDTSLTVRESLVQAGTSVASSSLTSVADTGAETTLVSLTLPNGTLSAGTTFRINVMGTIQVADGSGALTFRPYLCGAAAAQRLQMASQPAAAGPVGFHLETLVTVYAAGAAGAFVAHGRGEIGFASPVSLGTSSTATAVIDTTQRDPVLGLTATWETAHPRNSLQVSIATIEKVAG
jgi:hypothetical protein